jgi:hypothetical protein
VSFGDGLFRALLPVACFVFVFCVCLVCQHFSERPGAGFAVERGQQRARRRRVAVLGAALVLALAALFAAPVFLWPDVAVALSGTLLVCALLAPLIVLVNLAAERPGVAILGWLACVGALASTLWLLGGSLIATAGVPGRFEQEATLVAVRQVGEAFERWRRDQGHSSARDPEAVAMAAPAADVAVESESESRSESGSELESELNPDPTVPSPVRLDDLPVLNAEALARQLVPGYLQALPATDGWGHPLELRGKLDRAPRLAIRSPGRDGEPESDAYAPGVFDALAFDEDVVWVDGIFVRQPGG